MQQFCECELLKNTERAVILWLHSKPNRKFIKMQRKRKKFQHLAIKATILKFNDNFFLLSGDGNGWMKMCVQTKILYTGCYLNNKTTGGYFDHHRHHRTIFIISKSYVNGIAKGKKVDKIEEKTNEVKQMNAMVCFNPENGFFFFKLTKWISLFRIRRRRQEQWNTHAYRKK